jgi:hypothetical protein
LTERRWGRWGDADDWDVIGTAREVAVSSSGGAVGTNESGGQDGIALVLPKGRCY